MGAPTGIDWLAGIWVNESEDGGRTEEWWMSPRGELMVGMQRTVRPQKRTFFENLRTEEADAGIVYVASARGEGETRFLLIEAVPGKAVFENPEHDFPRRIIYWMDEDGRLRARIEGESDGAPRIADWTWDRGVPRPPFSAWSSSTIISDSRDGPASRALWAEWFFCLPEGSSGLAAGGLVLLACLCWGMDNPPDGADRRDHAEPEHVLEGARRRRREPLDRGRARPPDRRNPPHRRRSHRRRPGLRGEHRALHLLGSDDGGDPRPDRLRERSVLRRPLLRSAARRVPRRLTPRLGAALHRRDRPLPAGAPRARPRASGDGARARPPPRRRAP